MNKSMKLLMCAGVSVLLTGCLVVPPHSGNPPPPPPPPGGQQGNNPPPPPPPAAKRYRCYSKNTATGHVYNGVATSEGAARKLADYNCRATGAQTCVFHSCVRVP